LELSRKPNGAALRILGESCAKAVSKKWSDLWSEAKNIFLLQTEEVNVLNVFS